MPEATICPVDGCQLTVDILLKSSDGKLIGAHQRNLEMFSDAFPIAGTTVVSDPVFLEETAEVLRLMLRYTHNTRLLSLDGISFTLLASLAEAVEKYMIYSAMEFCKIRMWVAIDDYPEDVFLYSTKHNYPDLADKAAKLTLRNPVRDFLSLLREAGLQDDIAFRWFRYREGWMEVFRLVLVGLTSEEQNHKCSKTSSRWPTIQNDVIKVIIKDLSVLDRFDDIVDKHFKPSGCSKCLQSGNILATEVKNMVKEKPMYSQA